MNSSHEQRLKGWPAAVANYVVSAGFAAVTLVIVGICILTLLTPGSGGGGGGGPVAVGVPPLVLVVPVAILLFGFAASLFFLAGRGIARRQTWARLFTVVWHAALGLFAGLAAITIVWGLLSELVRVALVGTGIGPQSPLNYFPSLALFGVFYGSVAAYAVWMIRLLLGKAVTDEF